MLLDVFASDLTSARRRGIGMRMSHQFSDCGMRRYLIVCLGTRPTKTVKQWGPKGFLIHSRMFAGWFLETIHLLFRVKMHQIRSRLVVAIALFDVCMYTYVVFFYPCHVMSTKLFGEKKLHRGLCPVFSVYNAMQPLSLFRRQEEIVTDRKGVTSIQMFERNHVLFIVWSFAPFVVSHRIDHFSKCCHQIFPLPCLGLRPVSSSQSFECSAWYESCACCGFSERVGPCASCKSHLETSVWEITWQDS